jgi:hypothetical protein
MGSALPPTGRCRCPSTACTDTHGMFQVPLQAPPCTQQPCTPTSALVRPGRVLLLPARLPPHHLGRQGGVLPGLVNKVRYVQLPAVRAYSDGKGDASELLRALLGSAGDRGFFRLLHSVTVPRPDAITHELKNNGPKRDRIGTCLCCGYNTAQQHFDSLLPAWAAQIVQSCMGNLGEHVRRKPAAQSCSNSARYQVCY